MSYSEPLLNQIRVFFLSIGVGAFLCLCYIAVQSLFRLFGKGDRVYYFADGAFCVVFAFISFFFMVLYNSGQVRFHLVFGEAVGFFALYLSVGSYIEKALLKAAESIRRGIGLVLLPVRLVTRHFCSGAAEIRDKIRLTASKRRSGDEGTEKKTKKFHFLFERHLKNKNKSV